METEIELSQLGHTWILDLDGTIVKHNGYINEGKDIFLDGAKEFLNGIPENDMIIFLTSRKSIYKGETEEFLRSNGIRYHTLICDAPYGERILMNDAKPSGLSMVKAISTERDKWCSLDISINEEL